jgi:hypothetical protein
MPRLTRFETGRSQLVRRVPRKSLRSGAFRGNQGTPEASASNGLT